MAKRKTRATATMDAVQILYRRYYAGRPERVWALDEARETKRGQATYSEGFSLASRPPRPSLLTAAYEPAIILLS